MFTVLNYFILHTTSRLGAFSMNHLHVTANVDEKYVYVVMRKIVVVSGSRGLQKTELQDLQLGAGHCDVGLTLRQASSQSQKAYSWV